jgi:fumarate reductase subunit D
LWLLFSAGGVVSALVMPSLLFLFGLAFPLGWLQPPAHDHLLEVLRQPLTRLGFVALCVLSLFHWAHRFRYTLYDGLQIKHLNELIATLCYGGAITGSLVAAYLAWQVP